MLGNVSFSVISHSPVLTSPGTCLSPGASLPQQSHLSVLCPYLWHFVTVVVAVLVYSFTPPLMRVQKDAQIIFPGWLLVG